MYTPQNTIDLQKMEDKKLSNILMDSFGNSIEEESL